MQAYSTNLYMIEKLLISSILLKLYRLFTYTASSLFALAQHKLMEVNGNY